MRDGSTQGELVGAYSYTLLSAKSILIPIIIYFPNEYP